jgi:hypothetical protein
MAREHARNLETAFKMETASKTLALPGLRSRIFFLATQERPHAPGYCDDYV